MLPPEIPHKRCLRSLAVEGVTVVGNGNLSALLSCVGQRKRPKYYEDSRITEDLPSKVPANRGNSALGCKCKSRTFEDAGKPVAMEDNVKSNKRPNEHNAVNARDKVKFS